MSATLIRTGWHDISLPEIVSACADFLGTEAIALLYSRQRCVFARLTAHGLAGPQGDAYDAGDVFEARLFATTGELRWRQRRSSAGERRGEAVLLHDAPDAFSPSAAAAATQTSHLQHIATQSQNYLLWGRCRLTDEALNWSVLGDTRIGNLSVPLAGVLTGQRVVIRAREYFVTGEFGNVFVGEERLLGLAPYGERSDQ